MSAEARESSIAALDVRQTPDLSPHAPVAAPNPVAPLDSLLATVNSKAKTKRLMILGYLILIASTVLVYFIPRFRLSLGWGESVVVLVSMISLLAGAIIAMAAFIWPLLRRV